MISYRDMTFCKHHEDCAKAATCHRPLTDEVREKARKWWGGDDVPIAVFGNRPACHSKNDQAQEQTR